MNDFTREELERIKYILDRYDFREVKLINKLHFMIGQHLSHECANESSKIEISFTLGQISLLYRAMEHMCIKYWHGEQAGDLKNLLFYAMENNKD